MKLTSRPPCIALLTDFGTQDPYVAVMKGVILNINPDAKIVDISHDIVPQSVLGAAFQLQSTFPYYPEGTLFVAVVDPEVGTRRRILYAETDRHRFLAPDNGLLSLLGSGIRIRALRSMTNRRYMWPEISGTFHGRDIFAPLAGWISIGVEPSRLGPPTRRMTRIAHRQPRRAPDGPVFGRVVHIDRFGNLITDIPASAIRNPKLSVISVFSERIKGVSKTYASGKPGRIVAVIGSADTVEIAKVGGSAQAHLNAAQGIPVAVCPPGVDAATPDADDTVMLMETNLDNVTGEEVGAVFEKLFACGALDVWCTPIQMKKSRPGLMLSLLAPLNEAPRLEREILRHTPTFGVRCQLATRRKLIREVKRARTKYGSIRCKIGTLDGKAIRAAPEYEDVAAAARRANVPFDVVHQAAAEAGRRLLDE